MDPEEIVTLFDDIDMQHLVRFDFFGSPLPKDQEASMKLEELRKIREQASENMKLNDNRACTEI